MCDARTTKDFATREAIHAAQRRESVETRTSLRQTADLPLGDRDAASLRPRRASPTTGARGRGRPPGRRRRGASPAPGPRRCPGCARSAGARRWRPARGCGGRRRSGGRSARARTARARRRRRRARGSAGGQPHSASQTFSDAPSGLDVADAHEDVGVGAARAQADVGADRAERLEVRARAARS